MRYIFIFLGFLSMLLRQLANYYPTWIEQNYSREIFISIRKPIDYILNIISIGLLPVLIIASILFIFWSIFQNIRKYKISITSIKNIVLMLMGWAGAIVFLFNMMWGFNYNRVPIEQQLSLTLKPINETELFDELLETTDSLVFYRNKVSVDTVSFAQLPDNQSVVVRNCVQNILKKINFPSNFAPVMRLLSPKGSLLCFGAAGMYLPITGECNVDAGLHPLQQPFTLAHEYCHAYGFTDEGVCNFLAFLACKASDDPIIRYSGYVGYWRYVARECKNSNPNRYNNEFKPSLPKAIRNDMRAIEANLRSYPDLVPNIFYDTYLKTQGIQEGVLNYNKVVLLKRAYLEK